MDVILEPHPESSNSSVSAIAVEVLRTSADTLELHYRLRGKLEDLVIPPRSQAERRDDLWKHTCFEAFVWPVDGVAYFELNLSPSTEWALYRFDHYRTGMRPVLEGVRPRIEIGSGDGGFEMSASVNGLPAAPGWRIALSAVIEERGGRKSFWTLVHPPGKPDFHHRDCFALELASPTAS